MSAQITKNGFNELLTKIKNDWKYVELRQLDDLGNDIVLPFTIPTTGSRFDLSTITVPTADDRFGFILDLVASNYTVTIKLNGSDTDLKSGLVRKKISGAKLYSQAVGGDAKMQVVYTTPIQFTGDDDELVITMTIKM